MNNRVAIKEPVRKRYINNMEIITPSEVTKKLENRAKGEYSDLIQQLPVGAALKIHPGKDWTTRRESIYHYFLTRYKGQVSVRHLSDGHYYIVKIA